MIKNIVKSTFFSCLIGAIIGLLTLSVITNNVSASDTNVKLPATPSQISIDSSTEDILALMLDSDQKWNTLQAEYTLTQVNPESGDISSIEIQKFWLSDKGKLSRAEIVGDNINITFVKDDSKIYEENSEKANYFQMEIPETFQISEYNPRDLMANSSNVVYLHPYGKVLPTAYYDFLYPTGIAQGLVSNINDKIETISVIGEEKIAGRDTIIVERLPKNHLYWIDCQTGVILKVQYFGESGSWQTQFEAQSIEIDNEIDSKIYHFVPSESAIEVSSADFFEDINK